MITSTVQNSIVKTIDMSLLPPPAFVKTPLFSDVKSNLLSELQILYPQFNALLESDPAVKLLEIVAYREIIITARVNQGCSLYCSRLQRGVTSTRLALILTACGC